jgi:ABC-type phosphate transport system permease subunit
METKIDDIKECMDKIVIKSQSDDNKLEKRLVAIETEQKVSKEATNKKLVVIGLILTVITIIVNIIMR